MKNVVSNTAPGFGQQSSLTNSTKHTVVQCPKCQTKFAVDSKLIIGLDSPKFHCSRCDHVFSCSEFNQSYLPFKELGSSVQNTSPQSNSLELNQTLRQQRTRSSSRSLEIPKDFTPELRNRAPHENRSTTEPHDEQVTFDFFEDKPFEPDSFNKAEITFHDFPKSSIESALKEDFSARSYPNLKKRRQAGRTLTQFFASQNRWANLLILTIPLGLLLLILTITSIYISLNAGSSEMIAKVLPAGPTAAPSGLFIQNTSLQRLVLDTGEKAQVIAGTVINESNQNFSDITIEGLLFDSLGRELEAIKINISNSLAEARIKALSPEMINELQSTQMKKHFELPAGSKSNFILVLTNDSGNHASFYSIRIHSVRQ